MACLGKGYSLIVLYLTMKGPEEAGVLGDPETSCSLLKQDKKKSFGTHLFFISINQKHHDNLK